MDVALLSQHAGLSLLLGLPHQYLGYPESGDIQFLLALEIQVLEVIWCYQAFLLL